MISNNTERLFIVYRNMVLQQNGFVPHLRNFTMVYGPFSCLINVFFGLIFLEKFILFSNVRSILELILCNRNLTKSDILTLLSSDCRA